MSHGWAADLSRAVRSLRAQPALAAAAVLTLALGLGATTSLFAVADALLLRPLPVRDPRSLVVVTSDTALRHGFLGGMGWNYAMWDRLRARQELFHGAFAWTLARMELAEGGESQPATVLIGSGGLFSVLGISPVAGRMFTPDDDVDGRRPEGAVAVLGHRFWKRRFGGAASALGSRLLVNGAPLTIVGVAPDRFTGLDVGQPFDLAITFGADVLIRNRQSVVNTPRALLLTVMLRLRPGQAHEAATAALRAVQPQILGPQAPPFLKESFVLGDGAVGLSDRSQLRQRYQRPLEILAALSAAVLLIVCLNVATVLLFRTASRAGELSLRLALGATPLRLAREQGAEALVVAVLGACGAIVIAAWGTRGLLARLPSRAGSPMLEAAVGVRTAMFAVALASAATVMCGVLAVWRATRTVPMDSLRHTARASVGTAAAVQSGILVAAQVSLSIVLLSGAAMFVATSQRLARVPLGFNPSRLVVASVNGVRFDDASGSGVSWRRALDAVSGVAGVSDAAGSIWTPIGTGGGGLLVDASGRRADIGRQVAFNFVTPRWFRTYGIALRSGRDFDGRDAAGAARTAIVNDTLRRMLPGGADPGDVIDAGPCGREGCTVVGVVADTVYGQSLRDSVPPTVYLPLEQAAGLMPANPVLRITLRTADSAGLSERVAAALMHVDPRITFGLQSIEADLNASQAQERLLATLGMYFGATALLLCAVGIYGVTAHAAGRRRAEIGIRVALGGRPIAVVRGALKGTLVSIAVGAAAGVMLALWLSRYVASLLYGIRQHDPASLAAAVLTLSAVAAAAIWRPAVRALRVSPADLLRDV